MRVDRRACQVFVVFFLMVFLYFSYFAAFFKITEGAAVLVQFSAAGAALLLTFFGVDRKWLGRLSKFVVICTVLTLSYLIVFLGYYCQCDAYKGVKFLLVFVFCGYMGLFMSNKFDIKYLVFGLAVVSTVFLFLYLFFGEPSSSGTMRVVLGDANPIWNARLIGICLIYSVLHFALHKKNRLFYLLLIALSMIGIYMTGSRGPAVAALVSFAFLVSCFWLHTYKRLAAAIIFIFFIIAFYAYHVEFGGFLSIDDTRGTSGRDVLYSLALKTFMLNPLGIGFGGFESLYDIGYPHNIILESLVEAGVLFTLILFCFVFVALMSAVRLTRFRFYDFGFLICMFIYSFVNSMFSGDLTSPKELYVLMFFFLFMDKSGNDYV